MAYDPTTDEAAAWAAYWTTQSVTPIATTPAPQGDLPRFDEEEVR